ncbi:MAG TPA: hypothetical protein VL945_01050 [Candidatus Saccharimonadales bacterium]|nr:hypothetical protein [Candidatus Saccharimonadales bacterium]
MPSALRILSIMLGICSILFAIFSLAVGAWGIGIILLVIAILLLFAGFVLLGSHTLRLNSQSLMPSSQMSYSGQNGYPNPFKGINTLSGLQGNRKQQSGLVLLALAIASLALGSWIVAIILFYGALKLLMNPMQLNIRSQPSSMPGDDQDGFEDDVPASSGIMTGYTRV